MVRGTGTSLFALGRLGAAMVALIALGTGLVFAQGSTATILGVVRDTTGALVPGVSITVKHIDTGSRAPLLVARAAATMCSFSRLGRMNSPQPCRASSRTCGGGSISSSARKQ